MKKILKWGGMILLAIIVVLLLSGTALFVKGGRAAGQQYMVNTGEVVAATDSLAVVHGQRLTTIYGCTDCHGQDLSGRVMIDAPPFRVVASNLTPGLGGIGRNFSTLDFDRAIRNGVRPGGTSLLIMPSKAYHKMADSEAAAIIGYLHSLPPIDNELPATELKPLGRVLAGSGGFDVSSEVSEQAPPNGLAPAVSDQLEFGEYQSKMLCAYCHQNDFKGGVPMGPGPVPSDINPYGKLPVEQFVETMQTGVTPAGKELDGEAMPTKVFKLWTEEELAAVHAFLASL
ncbi:MAG: hypothetical protein HKN13_12975 [Rhodothermales bacterium]|nr:hypothetical protein [Rhodothermales bacterium]